MQIKRLTLTQFRAFEQAEFEFQPGMNLLVGVNGVGKSSVLDALRVLLSQALPSLTASRIRTKGFNVDDIAIGRGALTAELQFEVSGIAFSYLAHLPRERYIADSEHAGEVRGQTIDQIERNELTPGGKDLPKQLKTAAEQPLAVYFSPHRSLYSMATPKKQSSAEALRSRQLLLREVAEWWLVQEGLAREGEPLARRRLDVIEAAVTRFLDTFANVRAVRDPQTTLLLDKAGTTLDVRQLSDGERGMLALVFDLARRLSQANPHLVDPLRDSRAVVLIDELDLHLHPQWQRTVVEKLIRTFPSCQFIATTHSPQIIGEVPPEQIILLEQGKQPYRPDQSLGMDSNWILQILMDTPDRNVETTQQLERISDLIEDGEYEEAAAAIERLREQIPSDPELTRLQTRLDRLQILGE